MSLDKINKSKVSGFYDHKNRYIVNDINTIVSFYRLGNNGEKEILDLIRVNFLLSSKNLTIDNICVCKKDILITQEYNCSTDVYGYKASEVDFFGNKIDKKYDNFIPNTSTKKKIFPAVYYRWKTVEKIKNEINEFIDIRYLLAIVNNEKFLVKETRDLFIKENLITRLN